MLNRAKVIGGIRTQQRILEELAASGAGPSDQSAARDARLAAGLER